MYLWTKACKQTKKRRKNETENNKTRKIILNQWEQQPLVWKTFRLAKKSCKFGS